MESIVITLIADLSLLWLSVLIGRSKANPVSRFFLRMFCFAMILYLSALELSFRQELEYGLYVFTNRVVFGSSALTTTYLTVFLISLYRVELINKIKVVFYSFVLALIGYSDLTIEGVNKLNYKIVNPIEYSDFYIIYVFICILPLILTIIQIIYQIGQRRRPYEAALRIIILSTLLTTLLILFTNVFLPLFFNNISYANLPALWIVVWVSLIYWVIDRYELFGIITLEKRLIHFSVILVAVTLFFCIFTWIVQVLLDIPYLLFRIGWLIFISSVLFSILIKGIHDRSFAILEEWPQNKAKKTSLYLEKVRRDMEEAISLPDTVSLGNSAIKKAFSVKSVGILLLNKFNIYTNSNQLSGSNFSNLEFRTVNKIANYLTQGCLISVSLIHDLTEEEQPNYSNLKHFYEKLESLGCQQFYFKRISKDNYLLILVSEKKSNVPFSTLEVHFLNEFCRNVTNAVQNQLLNNIAANFNEIINAKVQFAITNLKNKYLQLQEVRNKERDMVDVVGHELRTPLAVIRMRVGTMSLRLDNNPASVTHEYLRALIQDVHDALDREVKILNDMIDSTKIEADRIEIDQERVDVVKCARDALLSQKMLIEEKKLQIIEDYEKEMVDALGDRTRIGEVVDNIVSNAIKYTPEGEVRIKVEELDETVKITVSDTGIGIPQEQLKKLGKKFFRVNNYVKKGAKSKNIVRPGGTGLGLYVTYNLVRLMNGEITVNSKLGKGTEFIITLPRYMAN